MLSGQTRVASVDFEVFRARIPVPSTAVVDRGAAAAAGAVVTVADTADLPDAGELRRRFRLTEREAEVALLLAQRWTSKEIARSLSVTAHTARRHTERVLAKLGIGCRRHVLAAIASATEARAVQCC